MPDFSVDLAVVIGIDDYSDAVGGLRTPVKDAKAVADLLASRFGYEVILRCDGEATLKKLQTLLEDELTAPGRVPEGSRLFFYFAGHGQASDGPELEGPRGSLVPHGGTACVDTHLSMDKLYKALTGLPCRHLLVVLDCCFAGSFRWAGRRPLYAPGDLLYEERYRHWVRHPAHWFLSSAAHDQYALDTLDRRRGRSGSHSPFAAAVLDGLEGKADLLPPGGDGVVTLAELYAYVQDQLSPHQTPLLSQLPGQTRGEYVFRAPGRPLPSAQSVVLTRETNPYRGLKPYRVEHEKLFFGRGTAARRLLRHVRKNALTVVLGPSGSGKSSLVQAGLLSRLRLRTGSGRRPAAGWRILPPLRVTADPFADLHIALAAAGGPPPPSAEELRRDAGTVTAWAAAWRAAHPRERLVLFVDQAEELVTRVARNGSEAPGNLPAATAVLMARLNALLSAGEGRLRVLLTLRSDFEPDLEGGPLAGLWKAGRFLVPALTREELREVVEGPAALKALYFDDPRMVERLVDEVVGMPGGLPLLSYALSQLYLAYIEASRGDRLLTAADLAKIGGETDLEGPGAAGGIVRILRKAADDAVRKLPDDAHRETFWRVLLRMVNLVGVRPTRRRVPAGELDYPDPAENRRREEVLARLVDARLLVKDKGVVEPAHDELLVAWPELAWRIAAAKVRLPVHRRLGEAAMEWPAAGRRRRDLDLRLLGLVEAARLPDAWLNQAESEYVTEARQERRRRTRLQWSAIAAILVLSVVAAFFLYRSDQQRQRALLERSASLVHGAAAANRQFDFAAGGLLGIESLRLAKTDVGLASLALSKNWSWPLLSLLRGHTGPLSGISYSPDGRWLVSTSYSGDEKLARLWDARSFKAGPVLSHAARIYQAVFHPNSQLVAVTDYENKVWIWDFDAESARVACSIRHDDVFSSTFEVQGRFIVTYSSKSAKIWDLGNCDEAKILSKPLAEVENNARVRFDPIPLPSVFTSTSKDAVLLWRIESKRPFLYQRLEHPGGVNCVDFSADGMTAITSGTDGTARVWDLSGMSAKLKQELRHDGRINSGDLSPDGRLAVTASADGTAKVWEEVGGAFKLKSLLAHGAEVKSAFFDPAGKWIASWSYPRKDAGPNSLEGDVLWIWEVDSGSRTAALLSDVVALDFSPDGKMLAVAGFDNTARIWSVGPARREIPRDGFIGNDTEKTVLGLDSAGELILIDRYKEQIRVWNLPDVKERFRPLDVTDQILPSFFLSKNGTRIVANDGRELAQWDARTGERIASAVDPDRGIPYGQLRGGPLVVSNSYRHPEEGLQLKDLRSGEVSQIPSQLEMVEEALVSEDGAYVALVGTDRSHTARRTELWDLKNGRIKGRFEEGLRLEAMHPKGQSIVGLTGPDNRFIVLAADEDHPRVIIQDGWVMSARFSPDGSQLVTASRDGTALVWDTRLWTPRGTLAHGAWVTYATYDPRGELIATTANDGSTKIWSALTHELLATLQHHQPQRICLFSPDSSVLVSQSADKATVWRWRDEIIDPEEERLVFRFATARQLKGLASERESWLRLPARLPTSESRAPVREAARNLLAKAPSRSTVTSAADAVLGDPDPALAWIDLFVALAEHPRSNGYRLLVLEELERRGGPSVRARNGVLKLLLAATRAEGAEDPDGGEGTADRLREELRQTARTLLKQGYRYPVVEALAAESSSRRKDEVEVRR